MVDSPKNIPEHLRNKENPEKEKQLPEKEKQYSENDTINQVQEVIENREISNDFFSEHASRLGYRSNVTLAVRKALAHLEREASKENLSLTSSELRRKFLESPRGRDIVFMGSRLPYSFILNDYRLFLLLCIHKKRNSRDVINFDIDL